MWEEESGAINGETLEWKVGEESKRQRDPWISFSGNKHSAKKNSATHMKNLSLASVFSSASMQSCTTIRAEVASTWMFLMAYLWRKARSVFDFRQDSGQKLTTNVHHWYPGLDVAGNKKQ